MDPRRKRNSLTQRNRQPFPMVYGAVLFVWIRNSCTIIPRPRRPPPPRNFKLMNLNLIDQH